MRRRDMIGLAAGAGLAASLARPAVLRAQTRTAFKCSDVHPPGYPTVEAVEAMGRKLAQATDGRLSIQMYPSMQLGGEREAIQQAQAGALAMVRTSVGTLGPVVDAINVVNLPFMFRDVAHSQKVLDGEIGRELLQGVASSGVGLVGLCWMDSGARGFYNARRPIRQISDLEGLKIRVIANPIFIDMMTALGGEGIGMGYDQVYSALMTGVVDGAENNMPSFVFDRHLLAARHYSMTEHLIVPEMLVFSRRIWEGLAPNDQALIARLAGEAQEEERGLWQRYEGQALDRMRSAGIDIRTIADKTPFRDAIRPVWDKHGPRFTDLIGRIQGVA